MRLAPSGSPCATAGSRTCGSSSTAFRSRRHLGQVDRGGRRRGCRGPRRGVEHVDAPTTPTRRRRRALRHGPAARRARVRPLDLPVRRPDVEDRPVVGVDDVQHDPPEEGPACGCPASSTTCRWNSAAAEGKASGSPASATNRSCDCRSTSRSPSVRLAASRPAAAGSITRRASNTSTKGVCWCATTARRGAGHRHVRPLDLRAAVGPALDGDQRLALEDAERFSDGRPRHLVVAHHRSRWVVIPRARSRPRRFAGASGRRRRPPPCGSAPAQRPAPSRLASTAAPSR